MLLISHVMYKRRKKAATLVSYLQNNPDQIILYITEPDVDVRAWITAWSQGKKADPKWKNVYHYFNP